jgi:enoyl-CoA hydratase/carnithine racemase
MRSYRPVICKVHGYAVAGGSDIALCADMIVMSTDAKIGYMPTPRLGMPNHGDVGLSAGPGAGQAYAVHRR